MPQSRGFAFQWKGQAMTDIETLHEWISQCAPGRMVFFGGAGVSTESGIPDFRSSDGIFMQSIGHSLQPEVVVSRSFFEEFPQEFYDFYCDKMVFEQAEPNMAHKALAQLEAQGTLGAIVTQNIDGLHQAAGSRAVFELHGSIWRNHCMRCGKAFDLHEMLAARAQQEDGVPRCSCSGVIKPDVVLYEESLDSATLEGSLQAIERAELLLIAGTSLVVNPAASLVHYFSGKHLAIVNLSPTPADKQADLCIRAKIGEALAPILG